MLPSLGLKKVQKEAVNSSTIVYRLITSKEIVAENGALDEVYSEAVKSVTEQVESMKFNTAIAQLMVFVNASFKNKLYVDYAKGFIQLIAPFAPHDGRTPSKQSQQPVSQSLT